jgi:hypothetical protein
MYIVKNFENPFRNIHLSYHDGEHYNSVRLLNDFDDDVPKDIPLELINCVEKSSDFAGSIGVDNEAESNSEDDEEEKSSSNNTLMNNSTKESSLNEQSEIKFLDTIIKSIEDRPKEIKLKKCILIEEGIIMDELTQFQKCHCSKTNKKYKNCCSSKDLKGEYDKSNSTFYCNLDTFKKKFHYEITPPKNNKNTTKEKSDTENKDNNEISNITKHMEKIFI